MTTLGALITLVFVFAENCTLPVAFLNAYNDDSNVLSSSLSIRLQQVYLHVDLSYWPAVQLYESLGYEAVGAVVTIEPFIQVSEDNERGLNG